MVSRFALALFGVTSAVIERTPKGRVSIPEDMVGLTIFLCTDESEFIVGQAINVDGGVLYY